MRRMGHSLLATVASPNGLGGEPDALSPVDGRVGLHHAHGETNEPPFRFGDEEHRVVVAGQARQPAMVALGAIGRRAKARRS